MKRFLFGMVWAVVAVLSIGCATMTDDAVKQTDTAMAISPTLVAKQPVGPLGLKRKIAIARFSNETKYGQSFFLDKNNDRIGKQAVDILSNKLLGTEKFIVLERADLDKIAQELKMEEVSPLRNMADYLIVGSVTEFGRRDQSKVGIFSRVKKQIAFAKVNVRMIDVYTGQVIYAEEGDGEAFSEAGSIFGVGDKAGYDSALNDKALEAAITNLSSNIIENLLDKPWRAYILGYENGFYILSGGKSQNIKTGDRFEVVLEGQKIKNPQTNMLITLPGKAIAELEIAQTVGDTVENEVSLCTLITGELIAYNQSKDYSKLYVQPKKGAN